MVEEIFNIKCRECEIQGENWHYIVKSNENYFDSFLFNDLEKLDFPALTSTYRKLFYYYQKLGEKTFYNDFEKEIGINDFKTDFKTINPLVFWYYNQKSVFNFHKHDIKNQRFQLLTNLTQPGYDYSAGETLVYMGEGKPDLKDDSLREKCIIFGDEFEIGDVFSFPYDRWHMVNKSFDCKYENGARVSLLMPLGMRNDQNSKNELL